MNLGVNTNELLKLAKADPSRTQLYLGLHKIDTLIKDLVANTIEESNNNPKDYYIKTEITGQCYILQLFSAYTNGCCGTIWPLADFLISCENKTIEMEVVNKTKLILSKLNTTKKKYKSDKDIIWT